MRQFVRWDDIGPSRVIRKIRKPVEPEEDRESVE